MLENLRRKICDLCEARPLLTVDSQVPKVNFRLPNGVRCQASKSTGSLWASLSTLSPKQLCAQANQAFDQFVWTFRFKGKRFEIFLDGKCHCPLCFINKLVTKQNFDALDGRLWVFGGHVFDPNTKEEALLEEAIRNNCPPEIAVLIKHES